MDAAPQKSEPVGTGSASGAAELLSLVYDELRHLAAVQLAREKPGQTLQATALVHEAWLRLAGQNASPWQSRRQFFGAAAEAIRRILIDRARSKGSSLHGGGMSRVEMGSMEIAAPLPDEQLLALHDALDELAGVDPAAAELVKLRFFVGLTHAQAAEVLGLSRSGADRAWVFARAWLFHRIRLQKS